MKLLKFREMNESYNVGDKVIAKHNYLDFKKGEEYEITSSENCLGDDMFFLSKNGRKVNADWGLKNFELDIQFDRKN